MEESKEKTAQSQKQEAANAKTDTVVQQQQGKTLFGSINYKTEQDLDDFLANMDGNHALMVMIAASRAQIARGGLQPEEAEILSKSLRVVTRPPAKAEVKEAPEERSAQPASDPGK